MRHVPRSAALALALALAAATPALAGGDRPSSPELVPDRAATALLATDVERRSLTTQLADPTSLDVASDGRVFVAERTGRVKAWSQDGRLVTLGRIGVDSKAGQCDDCPGRTLDEGGLHGLLLARDFAQSGHVYLYYSVPNSLDVPVVPAKHAQARGPQETEGKFRLSRFTVVGDRLDPASEVRVLENPAEWFHCCHYGGDMQWLADGTLVLSTGDDTISSQSGGYSPHDQRIGQEFNSADLTSQNPADRRGKMLRLNPDGSVPADNPFVGDPAYDPYVYAMGFRSPYRFTVDSATGRIVTGNVGPDGRYPSPDRGPAAHDEIEIVPKGGGTNHGWPRCTSDNLAYNEFDFQTGQAGQPFSCAGMTPAAFSYSYTPYPSNTNLLVTPGIGNALMAGVVYRPTGGALALPASYRGKLFFYDWSRGGVQTLATTPEGGLSKAPLDLAVLEQDLASPIDMATGPDGAVYLLEYGGALYNGSGGQLSRFVCAGCTPSSADYDGAPVQAPAPAAAAAAVPAAPARSTLASLSLGGLVLSAAALVTRRRRGAVA